MMNQSRSKIIEKKKKCSVNHHVSTLSSADGCLLMWRHVANRKW